MVLNYLHSLEALEMDLVTLASATAAAGFLAGGAGRLAIAGWRRATTQLHQLRYQGQIQSELRRQATRARLAGQAHWQATQGTHSPWRVMEVVEVVDESLDVRSFYLQDPLQPADLPTYVPGQFVIVRPALGGVDLPSRCYSLSDAPGQNWYRISVKRQRHGSRTTPGLSCWLHDHIHVGDCLLISGPHGAFKIDADLSTDVPIVLLSAGVGITPLISMLKSLLRHNSHRSIGIMSQVQDTDHWPFGELIHSWGKQCDQLQTHTFFSRLADAQLPSVESGVVHAGKFDPAAVCRLSKEPAQAHYYMCGPDSWMADMESGLAALGVPKQHINWESFASESDTEAHDKAVADWEVRFLRSGISTSTSHQPGSILQAASAKGLNLPAACHSGACGTCKLKLVKGSVQYSRRPTCSHRDDEVVACVAQAVGSVEVDA